MCAIEETSSVLTQTLAVLLLPSSKGLRRSIHQFYLRPTHKRMMTLRLSKDLCSLNECTQLFHCYCGLVCAKKTLFCAESFRFPLLQRIIIELLWALLSTVITETSFSVLLTQPRVAWQFMFCFLIPCAKWSMLCEFTVKRWQCRCWKSAYLGHSWGSFFTYSSFNTHSYHTPRSMIKMYVFFYLLHHLLFGLLYD